MGKSLERLILEALAQAEKSVGREGQRAKEFVDEFFTQKPGKPSSGAPKKPANNAAAGAQSKQKKAPSTFEERQRQRAEKLSNQGRDDRKRRADGRITTKPVSPSSSPKSALGQRAETANRTLSAQRSYEEQKEAERRYREYKELLEDNENLPFEDPLEENSALKTADAVYSKHALAEGKGPWPAMHVQLRGTNRQKTLQQALLWREILGPPKSRR